MARELSTDVADRAVLGAALRRRAGEIAQREREAWIADQRKNGRDVDDRTGDDIFAHNMRSTEMMATYLATGTPVSSSEFDSLSTAGKAAAHETMLLADIMKLYLRWRDLVVRVLSEEAVKLGTSERALEHAIVAVTRASDSSIVRMSKQFDRRRDQLQSRLREDQERLEHQTCHDALTGLPNRTLLFRMLRELVCLPPGGKLADALLFVDVDNFKEINDTAGHAIGDEVLIGLARRLTELVRPTDTVARLAGDEFVIIARALRHAEADAVRLAKRIQAALAVPVTIETTIVVSVSIGVARIFPGDDPELALGRADRAMYLAKQRGRACHQLSD